VSDPEFDHAAALRACAAGDRHAQQARRIVRDTALAEDIVHDAFIKIWTRAATADPARGSARGWIYSVVRHQALNAMRDGAHEVGVDDDTAAALDADAALAAWREMADHFECQASAGRVRDCLGVLEPVRRNCILHAYVDGLSHSEIAARIGAPLGTVKAWIKRSLTALRECMG
jgi:RNA polymerase sigma-70 factor (ECF subfamily)